jgi:hypothetical protein
VKRILAASVAVLVVVAAGVVLAACGSGSNPIKNDVKALDQAKDLSAKASMLAIQTGIQTYIGVNGEAPPQATQAVLGELVAPWPKNPFTNKPMAQGSSPGDYNYTPLTGTGYKLNVILSDGKPFSP